MRFANLLLLCILSPLWVWAQEMVTLSGMVKDTEDKALPSVAIAIENSSSGVYSEEDGSYALQVRPGTYTLLISSVGYEPIKEKIQLTQDTHRDFILKSNSVNLSSVEVYGKSKSQQIKEGALSVNALDIQGISTSVNSLNTIINRSTGIRIREEGGVGSDFELSINGMSGNSVRYFLDGIPLDTKGSGITLANLPVNIIDRIEIYKGVVPASLGADALGGAINIITKETQQNYLDVSYGIGSFHTHKVDLNAQFVEKRTGLLFRPTFGINYSKNDYTMKGVEVWDEASREYILQNRKRFHDDYLSLFGQIEIGVTHKPWADALFVSASYSQVDKELQTGSVQTKVYGMAERQTHAWNLSARYQKRDFLWEGLQLNASLSHTWDYSLTIDTAFRKYDWNGDYITSSRNEITGRARSMRHYNRPTTIVRTNLDYALNAHHALNLNYLLTRTGNDRYDEVDTEFESSNDLLAKHIIGLSYNQSFFEGKMENTFFVKDYINHVNIRQQDLYWITGSEDIPASSTHNYIGYGVGTRYTFLDAFALKASFEHSVRLPMARELLGNGTTVYANVKLSPEESNNVNAGLFGTYRPASGHTLYYEANGFLRYVDNYIQAVVSEKEGMMQYQNLPAVHIKGVEGEIRYDWQNRLQLQANACYQDARDQMKFKSDGKPSATYNNRVPNKPWLFCNANASYSFYNIGLPESRLRISYDYQWVHWFFLSWEAYGALESKARIPAQHISSLALSYSWKNERYNLSIQCDNLFDATAYDNYKLQKPGRSFPRMAMHDLPLLAAGSTIRNGIPDSSCKPVFIMERSLSAP